MADETPVTVKQRIIHAAAILFVNGGYNGLSMREIAEAVGITKPALYYHFKDKDELILAVLLETLEEYHLLLEKQAHPSKSVYCILEGFIYSIFSLPTEKRALIYMAEQEIVHLSAQSRAQFYTLYRTKFIDKITRIFEAGMLGGELRVMDASLLTHMFLGLIFPFFRYPIEDVKSLCESTLNVFFNGAALHVSA